MANRIYKASQTELRPVIKEILPMIGNELKLAGIVFEGMGEGYMLYLPNTGSSFFRFFGRVIRPTDEEWAAILAQSDNPVLFAENDINKPIIRKLEYEISTSVRQKIWVRDGLKCVYCQRAMGEVTLNIDHFVPLELGGQNDPSNYLSSCQKCNRKKGNLSAQEWCSQEGLDYNYYVEYLRRFLTN